MPYAYAGFWKRFLAYILDSFCLLGIAVLLMLVPMLLSIMAINANIGFLLVQTLLIPAFWLYYTCLLSSKKQATLGRIDN
ncbi:MAG: RDD family protein [Candidatus Melainabacteria bacterium]